MDSPEATGSRRTPERWPPEVRRLAVFFAVVYAVQGLAEPQAGLATTPIFFLLKDGLGLTAAETSTFLALAGLAWGLKPLYGLVSDLVPIGGRRRRPYLLGTSCLAAAGWLALGSLPSYPYGLTLALLSVTGLGLAFTDVVCDAVMVEEGQRRGLTARFQAVQWSAIYAASLLAGIGGGLLAERATFSTAFRLIAPIPLATFAVTLLAVRERRQPRDPAARRAALGALRAGLRSGPLWRAAVFLLLWNFSPSFGVPLEYRMVDGLGFTRFQMGLLDTVDSAGALAGALLFGRYAARLPPARLLAFAVVAGAAASLAYYGLVGWWSAVGLALTVSLISIVATLATLDLAARAVPRGAEGTFFAALMAVSNLGTSGSTWLGGQLFELVGLSWLIAVSALTTAACAVLIPWLRVPVSPAEG